MADSYLDEARYQPGANGGPELDQEKFDGALAEDLQSFAHDPLGFVYWAFPWGQEGTDLEKFDGPDDWAVDLLIAIGDGLLTPGDAIQIAVSSGHGIGKSAFLCWIILWALSTMVDTKGVVMATKQEQLRTKTWPELAKWHRCFIASHWFKLEATSIRSRDPEHADTWFINASTWSERNTEGVQGLHNLGKRAVIIFDEASGIADKVWEVADGAMSDADTEWLWLVFGNPTKNNGRFFECFNRWRHRWLNWTIDSRRVKITNKSKLNKMVEDYGEDHDIVRVRVRGIFPRTGDMQFISTDTVTDAKKREATYNIEDPLIMGVDIARFGSDKTVIRFKRGRDARSIKPWKVYGRDTMVIAAKVAEFAGIYYPDAIFIDGGGVGGGVIDRLRQLKIPNVIEINNQNRATRGDCANMGAQTWVNMREAMEKHGLAIDDDPELETDLTGREYGYNAHNQYQLESKEDMKDRGMSSPDDADALALCFSWPVGPRNMEYEQAMRAGDRRVYTSNNHVNHDFDPLKQEVERGRGGQNRFGEGGSINDRFDPYRTE